MWNSFERIASFIRAPSGGADYSIYLQILIPPLTNRLLKMYSLKPLEMTQGQHFWNISQSQWQKKIKFPWMISFPVQKQNAFFPSLWTMESSSILKNQRSWIPSPFQVYAGSMVQKPFYNLIQLIFKSFWFIFTAIQAGKWISKMMTPFYIILMQNRQKKSKNLNIDIILERQMFSICFLTIQEKKKFRYYNEKNLAWDHSDTWILLTPKPMKCSYFTILVFSLNYN